MAVDQVKLQILIDILQAGGTVFCAQFLKVQWNGGANTKYYGTNAYSHISPFRDVKNYTGGNAIEARIMGDPFQKFDINGDLRTENLPIELDDADGEIKTLFDAYGASRVDLYEYYPQGDLCVNAWWGQILPPPIVGRFTQKTVMTNGYRSKERFVPNALTPKECVSTYSGLLSTLDKIATNLCPSDVHLGGSIGVVNPATGDYYGNCPKTPEACLDRLGTDKYFGGTNLNASPTVVDRPGNLAFSKGNNATRNKPVTWLFGTKHFRGPEVLIWAREPNLNHPDEGYARIIWRIGEGPVKEITNVKVNEKAIGSQHSNIRLGERGQPRTFYEGTTANFSSRAIVTTRIGPLNPYSVTLEQLKMECDVLGYALVAVWTDDETFERKWSDDRVWCLLEAYTNQKCGLGYEPGRFWIDEWIEASEWGRQSTTFTNTFPDGEQYSYTLRRTKFDAALEGRPAVDQVIDICRSGRMSVPFQYDGKYTIKAMRAATSDELDEAVIFTDHGDRNIAFDGGQPVQFTRTPDDKLINEIALTYEEATNYDIPRTIYGNDPDQQAKASKVLGDESFNVVPTQVVGFGIRNLGEAVKLLYHHLWFGPFDTGGTKNNCFAEFAVPYIWTHKLRRYDVFGFDLEQQTIPTGPNGRQQVETATAAGSASSSANLTVTVTAAGMTGSPVAVTVPITSGDSPAVWGPKVRIALAANTSIAAFFLVGGVEQTITLTAKSRAANDATMNIAIAAGTTGVTAAPTSANTTAGVADGPWEWFRLLNVRRIDRELAVISAVAYNRYAYEGFEVESVDPPTSGYCSIDADCPDGYVCRDGVCVPVGDPPPCRPALGTVTHDPETGELVIPVDPC